MSCTMYQAPLAPRPALGPAYRFTVNGFVSVCKR